MSRPNRKPVIETAVLIATRVLAQDNGDGTWTVAVSPYGNFLPYRSVTAGTLDEALAELAKEHECSLDLLINRGTNKPA